MGSRTRMRPSVRPRDLNSHSKKILQPPPLQNRPGLTDTKGHILYDSIFMSYPEEAKMESSLVVARGCGEGRTRRVTA